MARLTWFLNFIGIDFIYWFKRNFSSFLTILIVFYLNVLLNQFLLCENWFHLHSFLLSFVCLFLNSFIFVFFGYTRDLHSGVTNRHLFYCTCFHFSCSLHLFAKVNYFVLFLILWFLPKSFFSIHLVVLLAILLHLSATFSLAYVRDLLLKAISLISHGH